MAVVNEAAPADVTPVAPTLVDGVALALQAEGIEVVTNLPDDVTIVIAESFLRNGIRVVRPRHEQNVILAADGFTRASGLPAVCVVGPGPGIAQTGTGLVTASRRRSPVLVIVGERPSIRGDDKELDIQRFVESTGARYLEMRSELTLADDLYEAMRQVRLRRGPVILNLVDVRLLDKPLSSTWSYTPTEDVVPTGVELDPQSSVIDDVGRCPSRRCPAQSWSGIPLEWLTRPRSKAYTLHQVGHPRRRGDLPVAQERRVASEL